jgi:hypothetical protein
MFILYALPIGVLAGLVAGGRLGGLEGVRIRWSWLALAGLLIQVLLFFAPVAERVGSMGTPIYLGSSLLVLAVVLRNIRLTGLSLVALGALANLAAITANGGQMPASAAAMAALGKTINAGYSNSVLTERPALGPLTDIFALPAGLPFANVFSVGDLLIGVGVAWAIAAAMQRGAAGNLQPR